jgi:hypothetical protein
VPQRLIAAMPFVWSCVLAPAHAFGANRPFSQTVRRCRDPTAGTVLLQLSSGQPSGGENDTSCEEGGRAFDWKPVDAFQGQRVQELRREASQEPPSVAERLGTVYSNVLEQGPGTAALILLFVLLTIGDVFFNISRGFICNFPGLCDPIEGL